MPNELSRESSKWEVLGYPLSLIAVALVMLWAAGASDDWGQPLAGNIIGLALFALLGGLALLAMWWKKFGRGSEPESR
jgi:hypothetical protein